jgi:hypothetical protein
MNKQPVPPIPKQRVLEVPVENTEPVVCERCQGTAWIDAVRIFRVSRLLSGTPTDVFARTPVIVCAGCGTPKEEAITTLRIQL